MKQLSRNVSLSLVVLGATLLLLPSACSKDEPDDDEDEDAEPSDSGGQGGETASGGSPASGGEGGADGSGGAPVVPNYPERLSETGLYEDIAAETLADGVQPFTPQFLLWSDGAEKKRYFSLPPGTQIDTTDMDNWEFPIGTKLWKEFSRDGVRVETRLLTRFKEGGRGWTGVAYIWNEDQSDAVAAPDGQQNAKGTAHDVPSTNDCITCHNERDDWPLGLSAVQLSHDNAGATLTTLISDGSLTAPPAGNFIVPGAGNERDMLGYFHANCGGCHRAGSSGEQRAGLKLWLTVDKLGTVAGTDTYIDLVNQMSEAGTSLLEYRAHGTDIAQSEVYRRMALRGEGQMPQVGTEDPDTAALAMLETWINSLPPP